MIHIEIAGIDGVTKKLLEIPKRVERAVLGEMAQLIHEKAIEGADKHTKAGALLRSLYNRQIPGGREIGHDPKIAPHAEYVLLGTRPHVIEGKPIAPRKVFPTPPNTVLGGIFRQWYVKTQKTLRWTAKIGGRYVFANKIHHPGYRGDHYLAEAASEAIRRMPEIVAAALAKRS